MFRFFPPGRKINRSYSLGSTEPINECGQLAWSDLLSMLGLGKT